MSGPLGQHATREEPSASRPKSTESRKFSPTCLRRPFTLQHFQRKPTFPLELERVLDMLYETREVSRDTRPHSRVMLSFPPQVRKPPIFPTSSQNEGRLLCLPGKECQHLHCTSRRGWYLLDTGGEPGDLVTIRKARISPSTQEQA